MGCGVSKEDIANVSLPGKDQYDRKDLIGIGNHGRVYRSIHLQTAKEYAVKVIDQITNQNTQLAMKERMALIERLKKLRSAFITPYYEIQMKEKEVAVVLDLAKEGSLKKYIQKNGKFNEAKASKITLQLLQGLNYLHANAILHKDLKTSNVLMTTDDSIKLTDFALAEIYDKRLTMVKPQKNRKNSQDDFSRGESLPYMAPQVIRHEGISDKSDIWSIGCIIIQMITGKIPFSDINTKYQKAFKQITSKIFAPLPKPISVQCREFLERCLVISPSKRSSLSQLMKHPFIRNHNQINSIGLEEFDKVKASLQKNDTANRISSRNSNKKDQVDETFKTPPSIERSIKNQNNDTFKNRFQYAPQKQANESNGSSQQLKKLKEAVTKFGRVKKSRDIKVIHNDDILPEILQDEEDMVMVNNKKVKMKPLQQKFKTQQTDQSEKRQYRNSIQLQENPSSFSINSNDRYRIKSKANSNFYQSDYDSRVKLQTQPILVSSDMEKDHQYFKKPLKLLKKKLKQRQKNSRLAYIDYSEDLPPKMHTEDKEEEDQQANLPQQSKIRTLSQQSRQEIVINTQLAKAQRGRYINQQLMMKRQKEKEKQKWQQQLKQESQVIKKQFSHRYAYQRYHPVLNMI